MNFWVENNKKEKENERERERDQRLIEKLYRCNNKYNNNDTKKNTYVFYA